MDPPRGALNIGRPFKKVSYKTSYFICQLRRSVSPHTLERVNTFAECYFLTLTEPAGSKEEEEDALKDYTIVNKNNEDL